MKTMIPSIASVPIGNRALASAAAMPQPGVSPQSARTANRLPSRWVQLFLAMFLAVAAAMPAMASHFRYGNLNWQPTANAGEVKFNFTGSFRRSSYGSPNVGDIFTETQGGTRFLFGDGGATGTLRFRVVALSVTDDYVIGEALNPGTDNAGILRTYAGAGPFVNAGISGSARISSSLNRANGSYQLFTTVSPLSGNSSPVSSQVPIVTVTQGAASTFLVQASDPNGDGLRYRISTDAEAGGGVSPPGMTINPNSGLVTWNTVGLSTAGFWTVQVIIEDLDASGNIKTSIPVDFQLKIDVSSGTPPTMAINPPGPFNVAPGSPIAFSVTGADVDGGATVTLNTSGVPIGSTMSPSLPITGAGSPGVASNFSWTPLPANSGSYVIIYTVTDNTGSQVQNTVQINVSTLPSPTTTNSAVTGITQTDATLNGVVNPNGVVTSFRFEYGLDATYGNSTAPAAAGSGTTDVPVSRVISGLSPNTVYHYRLVASSAGGNSVAPDATFTTAAIANTPPVLVLPASPVIAEATSSLGAAVTFSVSATDVQDGTAPAIATPASGSVFPIGDTTVSVSATDSAGATTTGSFVVRVQDTTAPTLTVPGPIVAEATSAAGAVVTFSVGATDAVSAVTPVATPASGSVFPIGTTMVSVSAVDAAGNPSTASFTVTVQDTTPPVVTAPANITVIAANAAGSVVSFSVSANDSVDGALTATASPASGSLFPIGTTLVNVSATDSSTNVGSASFTVTVEPSLVPVDDAVQAVAGVTLVYPLANDRSAFGNLLTIVSTSEPTVVIKGRALEIPAGYLGTFSYTVTDGVEVGSADVVVTAGTPIASPTKWQGLLYNSAGEISGRVTASKATTKIVATIQLGAGSGAAIFPVAGASGLAVPLGTVTAAVNADKHLIFTLVSGGNTYTGDLRPGKATTTARKHNIALASITPATIPGGGWARATTTGGARVGFGGKLPDGRILFGNALVRDNGSFVLYRGIIGTNPRGVIGGEFILADLAATDVTGELKWVLPPQARGTHAAGLTTTLTANGCVYNSAIPLPSGNATMHLTGGGLVAPFDIATTLALGTPNRIPAIPFWVTYPVKGVFLGSLKTPAAPLGARCSGVYLQKTNTAWGYMAGPLVGGRIEISLP